MGNLHEEVAEAHAYPDLGSKDLSKQLAARISRAWDNELKCYPWDHDTYSEVAEYETKQFNEEHGIK